MRSSILVLVAVHFLACNTTPSNICGDLVEDRATGSCQCPEGTTRGEDVWTCLLPDGGIIRDPNAPDSGSPRPDAGVDAGERDSGTDAVADDGCIESVWFRDRDRDGFGDSGDNVSSCVMPDGYVAEGEDCDDECSACTPFASELCDERDNDCDGSVDEGLPQVRCYQDVDRDGFGNESETRMACGCPAGWTQRADAFDCADDQPNVFPGQTEYFPESLDYDCDGTVTELYPNYRCVLFDVDDCNRIPRRRPLSCGEQVDVVERCDAACAPVSTRTTQLCR